MRRRTVDGVPSSAGGSGPVPSLGGSGMRRRTVDGVPSSAGGSGPVPSLGGSGMRRRTVDGVRRWVRSRVGRLLALVARSARVVDPERVLVVRVDERVGNVLLTLPVVRAVATGFVRAEVDFLVAASKVELAAGPFRTIAFRRRDAFSRPVRFVRLLWRLRRTRYDIAVDASHWHRPSLTAAALVAWSGAPVRVGHARPPTWSEPGPSYHTHVVENPQAEEPEVSTKLRLLRPLGVEPPASAEVRLILGGQEPTATRMRVWLEEHGLSPERFAAVCPGARKADHRVSPEVFRALAHELSARGVVPVVLWGPGERALAEAVAAPVSSAVCAPPTGLAELAALFAVSAVAVTNDTGPMHLAVASGARTLSLFRRSSVTRWRHPVPRHRVVRVRDRSSRDIVEESARILDAWLGPSACVVRRPIPVPRGPTSSLERE